MYDETNIIYRATSNTRRKKIAPRLPDKVFTYCDKIALKIARGEVWQRDWETLVKTLGSRTLAGTLGLPASIPPYNYDSSDLDALLKKFEEELN